MSSIEPTCVDVIIPTRNRLDLTLQAADSVICQTLTNWRLLIVDDGSDPSIVEDLRAGLEELEALAAAKGRIRLIERRFPGGASAARQTGLEAASAPFVALLDSDDIWYSRKLERQVAWYGQKSTSQQSLGAVLCWHIWENEEGIRRGPRKPTSSPLPSTNMSTILVLREKLVEAGGFLPANYPNLVIGEGTDFYLRLSQVCTFATVQEALVVCRDHCGPRTSRYYSSPEGVAAFMHLFRLHDRVLNEHPVVRSRLRARAAGFYLNVGYILRAMQQLALAMPGVSANERMQVLRRYGPTLIMTVIRKVRKRLRRNDCAGGAN